MERSFESKKSYKIFEPNNSYVIWVGSYIVPTSDINKINLNEYLFNGSIKVFALTDFLNLQNHFKNYGGTLLQYSAYNLFFNNFKPYGNKTKHLFEKPIYTLATVEFNGGAFNRIEEQYSVDSYFHTCVKRPEVSYVTCYGADVDDYSKRMIDPIIRRLNDPDKYSDELAIHINLGDEKDDLFSFTNKNIYDNNS